MTVPLFEVNKYNPKKHPKTTKLKKYKTAKGSKEINIIASPMTQPTGK